MSSRKVKGPRGLCVYFVDIKECDGVLSVPDRTTFLVEKCILDKIFSENSDLIAVCRSDTASASVISFIHADWDGLKKSVKVLKETRLCKEGGIENPISSLNKVVEALLKEAEEDTYDEKKIIYFSNLSSYALDEKEVTEIAVKLRLNNVFISIILPSKVDRSEIQIQNSRLIKNVFNQDVYESTALVTNIEQAYRQIINTQTKKKTRPSPWNVLLEITPQITICVGGYACTRRNKTSDLGMSRVLVKKDTDRSDSNGIPAVKSHSDPESNQNSSNKPPIANVGSSREKTVVVEEAKSAIEKEITLVENDGTVVSEDDTGKAYYFGDKLVPYNELENEGSYRSGEKCLKLLLFCPKEKISPAFLIGDGITLFYPKKGDAVSEVKFKALFQALINTNRIAIVRRVYSKNTRVTVGTLVPEEERGCLIFTELCFADDISVPRFPNLIKPEEKGDEDNNIEVTEKEALIDDLIRIKSLDGFHPSDGPCDPAIKAMREKAAVKILEGSVSDLEKQDSDNIDVFFKGMFVDGGDETALSEKIRSSFPLQENRVGKERLAGNQIFHKRSGDELLPVALENKKLKKDNAAAEENEKVEMEKMEENLDDLDNLLDEL